VDNIAELEARIASLENDLAKARNIVVTWDNATTVVARKAAEVRAKNQAAGRGFWGAVLGRKFRAAVRSGAAASNAAIAKEVAARRTQIADGKREARELVRRIQSSLSAARKELVLQKNLLNGKAKKASTARIANDSLSLLSKLKAAHDAGILTDAEYAEKRAKLIDQL